jgi:hypothetical protein
LQASPFRLRQTNIIESPNSEKNRQRTTEKIRQQSPNLPVYFVKNKSILHTVFTIQGAEVKLFFGMARFFGEKREFAMD